MSVSKKIIPSRAGRVAASLIPAAGLTIGLFLIMDRLVTVHEVELQEPAFREILSQITPEEPEVRAVESAPEDLIIPDVVQPPRLPSLPSPDVDFESWDYSPSADPEPTLSPAVLGDVRGPGPVIMREEAVPLRPLAVDYPHRALSRGLEGECEIGFSIDAVGRPFNIEANCSDQVFVRDSVRAVEQNQFAARIVDGVPVGQDNLVYPIQYRLDD